MMNNFMNKATLSSPHVLADCREQVGRERRATRHLAAVRRQRRL